MMQVSSCPGTVLGFSAILLPQLRDEMSLTSDEASWIAALSNIGQLFGAVMTGILSGKLGRRPTLMILCVPLLAGWVTVGLAGIVAMVAKGGGHGVDYCMYGQG